MTIVNLQSEALKSNSLEYNDEAPLPRGLCVLIWLAVSAILWSAIFAAF